MPFRLPTPPKVRIPAASPINRRTGGDGEPRRQSPRLTPSRDSDRARACDGLPLECVATSIACGTHVRVDQSQERNSGCSSHDTRAGDGTGAISFHFWHKESARRLELSVYAPWRDRWLRSTHRPSSRADAIAGSRTPGRSAVAQMRPGARASRAVPARHHRRPSAKAARQVRASRVPEWSQDPLRTPRTHPASNGACPIAQRDPPSTSS